MRFSTVYMSIRVVTHTMVKGISLVNEAMENLNMGLVYRGNVVICELISKINQLLLRLHWCYCSNNRCRFSQSWQYFMFC